MVDRLDGDVAIIGAGPAGLILGRLLARRGIAADIFERDASPDARVQGGSLDIDAATGQAALRAAGLEDDFVRLARPEGQAFKILGSDGAILFQRQAGLDASRPEIDRADLRNLLLRSVQSDRVHWGHELRSAEPNGRGWRLAFANGRTLLCRLLIGCDGAFSKVRRLVAAEARYIGITTIELTVDAGNPSELDAILGDGNLLAAGGGRYVWVGRMTNGARKLYFSWPLQQSELEPILHCPGKGLLNAVRRSFAGWSRLFLGEIGLVTDAPRLWPLRSVERDQRWERRPAVTLAGDAAHVIPPFTGQGVNLALFDALSLSDHLASGTNGDLDDHLRRYEAEMFARMAAEIDAIEARRDARFALRPPSVTTR
jgi:2-polyprenyl-6-methoxyphenol hydroxylase-like FAD-dependent oxidoreductase